jgi:redox-sensitive bicupin YhaK (pirin superfamily)
MNIRTVKQQHAAHRDDIGELKTVRPLPGPGLEQIDPFLFLNHHGPQVYGPNNQGLPFGPHPHRGFETVTFILDGSLAHRDSGGHESDIYAGGVQWMTAGRGLVHAEISSEDFKRTGGPLEILQLWVNLPARLKMTEPRYVGKQQDDIPVVTTTDGKAKVQVISGTWESTQGAVQSLTGVAMTTLNMQAGGKVVAPVPASHNVFLYVVRGEVRVGGQNAMSMHLIELNHDGDAVEIQAVTDAFLLFGHAEPFGEPVVAHGPFVMNTRDQIRQAIQDYQSGKFGGVLVS